MITAVDRTTRCITGWAVSVHRSEAIMQAVVDMGPVAAHYHSDAFAVYQALIYTPGHHFVWCWNQRQLWKQAHPRYAAHVIQFVYPLC